MPNKQQFESIVADTLRQLESLIVRLDEEYCALTGRDPQELQNAVHRKLAALAEIERNIVARDRVQTALGVPPGLIGGQQFVTQYAPELLSSWQKLTALCEAISQKNAANGQLVSQGTRQTRQALSVLTGRQDDNATYGRKGANKGALSSKFLGRV
jgi:flagellar biosynthesis/type III secretory pathway chaperone